MPPPPMTPWSGDAMEDVFCGVLDSIHLAELGWWWWMVALLLALRLMVSLLEPREGAGGGGSVRSLQGELQSRAACPNCGWRRRAAQVCPVCGLAPDERPDALPAPPDERRRKPRAAEDPGGKRDGQQV
jgi:ribosomal protein L32